MAFPCLPPSTQQERELMQVNKHLNDRIATLEASLAASEQCERELTELNQSLQAELTAAEEAAIRRCAAHLLAYDSGSNRDQCVDAILALLPPKAEAAK